ncbi:VOC family protein [Nonomuraea angiospora]|uniref:VOC family protein n=1 Tax=Nonomuraea angiospora TaxID=46172 RepID=UPI003329D2C3
MRILGVDNILVGVADLARAREFYGGVLGIEPFEVFTGWTVEVADPWGNIIGLTDYTKQPHLARAG